MKVRAYAALEPGLKVEPCELNLHGLAPEEVDIRVLYCGICHIDLSVLKHHWDGEAYPVVAGREIVGIVENKGDLVSNLDIGDRVGLGWYGGHCYSCKACQQGDFELCHQNSRIAVGHSGGFADKVRAKASWATPIPESIESFDAGSLFFSGLTVFSAMLDYVKPTDKVAVIGIGGVGHLAVQFLKSWGCEVSAYTSSTDKIEDLRDLGADYICSKPSLDSECFKKKNYDFILNTSRFPLEWGLLLEMLKPGGRLHNIKASPDLVSFPLSSLVAGNKSISGSSSSQIDHVYPMLDFVERHGIKPVIEVFPMEQINEALAYVERGKGRYRVVLKA